MDSSATFVVQSGVAKTYGTFSIDAAGTWSYTLNNDNAEVQALNTSSAPLHELVTVATADGTEKVIDITINGANDAAVITGTATDSVLEASGVLNGTAGDATASGDLNATDVDSAATFVVQTRPCQELWQVLDRCRGRVELHAERRQREVQALNTSSGTLHELVTVATADGTRRYRHHHQRHQRRGGDHRDGDGLGVGASGVLNGTAGDATASGDLNATDVDSAATFVVQTGVAKTYGTFSIDATGTWSYTLNDDNAEVQALNRRPRCTSGHGGDG